MAGRRITESLTGPTSDEDLSPFAIPYGSTAQRATGRKTMAVRKGDRPRQLAPKPTARDYAATVSSMAASAMRPDQMGFELGARLRPAIPAIAAAAKDYLTQTPLAQMGSDVLGGLRSAGEYALGDTANAIADLSRVGAARDFLKDVQRAASLRARGDEGGAYGIEQLAPLMLAAGIVPGGGAAMRKGERAALRAAEEGASGLAARAAEEGTSDLAARAAAANPAFIVPKPPAELKPLPGRGGASRRKADPETIISDAAKRVRAEAKHRLDVAPSAPERQAARATYTVGPIDIQPDPALMQLSLQPGSTKSVTAQAMELGVPVTGVKPFAVQHPEGYSSSWGVNKPDPTNFSAEYRDRIFNLDAPTVTGDDFEVGSGLFPMIGDATMTGRDIVSVNGIPLARPVSTHGGARYGLGEMAAGQRGVWSSDADIVAGQAKQIADWQRENPGKDVFGIHVNMGPSGSDFSHQTGAVIANLLPQLNLSDEGKRALDDYIRAGKEGLPDFEGFADDPYLGLYDMLTRPGGDRKVITARLANVTKGAQLEGVPANLGALARLAVAEPELRLAPQGSSGFSVVKFDPNNFFKVDPALLKGAVRRRFEEDPLYAGVLGGKKDFNRVDYNADLTGKFLGRTQRLVPAELLWSPVFDRAAKFTKAGKPTTSGMQFTSFKTDTSPIVTVTPQLQDALGEYLYRSGRHSELGWSKGGRVDSGLAVKRKRAA